jgi:hypothetical protein
MVTGLTQSLTTYEQLLAKFKLAELQLSTSGSPRAAMAKARRAIGRFIQFPGLSFSSSGIFYSPVMTEEKKFYVFPVNVRAAKNGAIDGCAEVILSMIK